MAVPRDTVNRLSPIECASLYRSSARILPPVIIAFIVLVVSLHPFGFRPFVPDLTPVHVLFESVGLPLQAGDLLRNVVLYMPLGYFCARAMRRGRGGQIILTVALIGGAFSLAIELAQYYVDRTPSLYDVLANLAGAGIGAAMGSLMSRRRR